MRAKHLLATTFVTAITAVGITGPAAQAKPPEPPQPVFSAVPLCQAEETDLAVTFGGVEGEKFDLYFNDVSQGGPYDYGMSGNFAVVGDGIYDVVILNHANHDDVRLVLTVFVGCDGPVIVPVASCDGGATSTLSLLITDNAEYLYELKVDDVTLDGYEAVDIPDLSQEYLKIDGIPAGQHSLEVLWTAMGNPVDSSLNKIIIESCQGDDGDTSGSGAGIPATGSDTSGLLVIAGALLLAGTALTLVRRRTA